MIVENDLDCRVGGIGGVEELEELDEFAAAVAARDDAAGTAAAAPSWALSRSGSALAAAIGWRIGGRPKGRSVR
jgi:hypothetical protein